MTYEPKGAPIPAHHVLAMRDGLKMVGVDTVTIAAEVVKFKAIPDGTVVVLPQGTVN